MTFLRVYHLEEFMLFLWVLDMHLRKSSLALVEVKNVEVVEEAAIESSEHHQALAENDTRVPPPWLWYRVSQFDLSPLHSLDIELVDITDVLFISSSENDQLCFIKNRGSVPPSWARKAWGMGNLRAPYRIVNSLSVLRILEEVVHLKDIEVIQVGVLWMASTKSNDFCLLNSAGSMESFVEETFLSLDCWFVPIFCLQVESPKVAHVRSARLTSDNHHVFSNESRCVVGPCWRVDLRALVKVHVMVRRTDDEFG